MKIEDLFNSFQEIDEKINGDVLEISVKQHQVTISLQESLAYFNDINTLLKMYTSDNSFITSRNDIIYITFSDINRDDLISEENDFYLFMKIIEEMSDKICACPSLEFIISKEYIKCFLDKPGLRANDLIKYEEILGAKGKGELELHPQRPYLLFINENLEV